MSNFFSTLTGKMIARDGYKSNAMVSVNWLIGFCQLLFGTGVVAGPILNVFQNLFFGKEKAPAVG